MVEAQKVITSCVSKHGKCSLSMFGNAKCKDHNLPDFTEISVNFVSLSLFRNTESAHFLGFLKGRKCSISGLNNAEFQPESL